MCICFDFVGPNHFLKGFISAMIAITWHICKHNNHPHFLEDIFLKLPLERPVQNAGQQRFQLTLQLGLQAAQGIYPGLQAVQVGDDAAL